MENFKEWISDNLRYILLGLGLILVLAVAIVGIRAISNIATGRSSGSSGTPAQTEAPQTESAAPSDVIVQDETDAPAQTGSTLVHNDAKVLTTMTAYYEARTNGDTETLRKLNPSMDDQEEANILNSYVESYSDVSTYSREGLTPGSYVVYVSYKGKVRDIDTLVPSLNEYYLMTDETGGLYIADTEGDTQVEAFCTEAQNSAEVQNLISSVNNELDAAKEADPALKEFMGQYDGSGASQNSGGETESGETSDEGESTEIVALDSCNVRSTPTTEEDNIIGSLYVGETAVKLGETDDGWTQIDYNGETAYVSSDFVATPEEAEAQNEADYFAPGAVE